MAEARGVALLVPNLFTRIPVEGAVRAAGAEPVAVTSAAAAQKVGCRILIVDLDAPGAPTPDEISALTGGGVTVLGFGPHVEAARLAAARQAGAVVLPRGAFLARLPQLLETSLGHRE
ncbi:MAG: hypothetical protein ACM3O7_00690 [Acidobacteriota bacterium]